MEKDFVPYEEALVLKELGFDEPCNTCYDKLEMVASYGASVFDYKNYNTTGYMVSRPTFSQAFRWFREKYGLKSWIQEHTADTFIYEIRPHKLTDYKEGEVYVYEVYEAAEIACLKKLIEIQGGNK